MSAATRIQWLHKYIVNDRYPNAHRLAERFGISHRQAQRDVETLRREYNAPLAYSAVHRGFYYTEEFSLPTYRTTANATDYMEAVTGERNYSAKQEILQMQIPFSATLRIADKLTRLDFAPFITKEDRRGDCLCEFHSVEQFLGLILTSQADITILSPDWLRERLVECAERALRNNAMIDKKD